MRGDDYPAVPASHFAERRAIRQVTGLLEEAGFLVQPTDAHFDKGLDLLVAPTLDGLALPAVAALQVRGGDSQLQIRTGRHRRYWAEMTMPVFGVVVPSSREGSWVDLGSYLREHPAASSVPPSEPLDTLPQALHEAVQQHNAVLSLAALGSPEAGRQLGALLSLWPLLGRADVVALVRSRLAHLDLLPTRLALELLVSSSQEPAAMAPLCAHELGALASKIFELSCAGLSNQDAQLPEDPIDSWSAGATYLWDLLQLTTASAADVLAASAHAAHAEAFDLCVFMAACLQPAADTLDWIAHAVRQRPHLADHPDLMQTQAALQEDPRGPGLAFPRHF